MKTINHYPPEMTQELGEGNYHKLDLVIGDEKVGTAELFYKNSPFPFYYIAGLNIRPEHRGAGHGKDLLRIINAFLKSKSKTGILINSIKKDNPAKAMYKNNGWQEIVGQDGWYIYNPPKNLPKGRVDKAMHEIVEMILPRISKQ